MKRLLTLWKTIDIWTPADLRIQRFFFFVNFYSSKLENLDWFKTLPWSLYVRPIGINVITNRLVKERVPGRSISKSFGNTWLWNTWFWIKERVMLLFQSHLNTACTETVVCLCSCILIYIYISHICTLSMYAYDSFRHISMWICVFICKLK